MPLHQTRFLSFLTISNFHIFYVFSKILIFSKFLEILVYHQSGRDITFSIFYHIHWNLQCTLDNIFSVSGYVSSSKTLLTPNLLPVHHFSGPSLGSLAIVSALSPEEKKYFHSRSHLSELACQRASQQPASLLGSQPASQQPVSQPARPAASQPAIQVVSHQLASRPAQPATSQPASKLSSQPASFDILLKISSWN